MGKYKKNLLLFFIVLFIAFFTIFIVKKLFDKQEILKGNIIVEYVENCNITAAEQKFFCEEPIQQFYITENENIEIKNVLSQLSFIKAFWINENDILLYERYALKIDKDTKILIDKSHTDYAYYIKNGKGYYIKINQQLVNKVVQIVEKYKD